MESGELKTTKLKFFGTFLTYPNGIKFELIRMEEQFKSLTHSKLLWKKKQ
jgi:hypothetical protein